MKIRYFKIFFLSGEKNNHNAKQCLFNHISSFFFHFSSTHSWFCTCYFKVQTIGHEMMHAAGFEHEQSRSDRDDYIRVIKENFNFAAFSQLAKENTTIYNPYDYESVLQYFLTVCFFFCKLRLIYLNSITWSFINILIVTRL